MNKKNKLLSKAKEMYDKSLYGRYTHAVQDFVEKHAMLSVILFVCASIAIHNRYENVNITKLPVAIATDCYEAVEQMFLDESSEPSESTEDCINK